MSNRWRNASRLAMRLLPVAFLVLQACGDDDPSGPDNDVVNLTSGVAVANIDGDEDSERTYRIAVPAGAAVLSIETTGGTGDVDMYVRFASAPTPTQTDCESTNLDNEELCEIDNPDAGNWYITLVGFEAYDNVTLTATVLEPIRR